MLRLGIGKFEIDWGKNSIVNDFSDLFQKNDLKLITYYYLDDDLNVVTEEKEGYSKKLFLLKRRLELLGYDLKTIEKNFYNDLDCYNKMYDESLKIKFEDYFNIVKNIDINKINMLSKKYDREFDLLKYVERFIFEIIPEFKKLGYNFGTFIANISPYSFIRILIENEKNKEFDLEWRFKDIEDQNLVDEIKENPKLDDKKKIIIVTEGSSDTNIIKNTILKYYEGIEDFLSFIDMEKNYPFTGAGNIFVFIKGLVKINVLNKMIFILDNDTEGNMTFYNISKLKLPKNLLVLKLPIHSDFDNFKCLNEKDDFYFENINGKAVSIELFLDFNSIDKDVHIEWKGFNQKLKQCQGVICPKGKLKKHFSIKDDYDHSKLIYLIEYILNSWINRD